jgi:uncharacterized repeat protein (TIGR01451 family)
MGQVGTVGRWAAGALTVGAVLVFALVASSLAGAAKVQPELIAGASNQGKECADNVGSGQTWTQLKIDPNADGIYSDGTLTVTISNTQDDKTFDWSSNIGVDAVIVKGGSDGTYLYRYDPPSEQTSDSGLTTPGQNAISHLHFCYDVTAVTTGSLTVIKRVVNDNNGNASSSDWTMNVAGPSASSFAGASDPGTTKTVDPGSYTVTESNGPSGYTLTYSGDCNASGNVSVAAGDSKTCILTNDDDAPPPPQQGRIIVEKQLDPDGYQPPQGGFVFSGAIQAVLGDGESADAVVDPGTYTVTESLDGRPFWDLTSLVCDDSNSSGDLATLTATYRVEAGETVRCVFTNTKRSLIIVKKITDPAGAEESFDFDANYDEDGVTLADGEQNVSDPLLPGAYSVTEHETPGWQLDSATCSNGDDPSDIDLPASVTVTCTFTNVPREKLTPTVTTDVHDASHAIVTSAPIGSSVHDSATVTGSGTTPTGSVSFRVFLGNLECSGDGSAAGTVELNEAGVAHPSDSVVVPVGGLSFRAHYEGDANYTSGDGPCETLAPTKLTPTVVTYVHNASHQVVTEAPLGSSVHDRADVTGSAGTPTGSVTFTVYLGNTTCSGESGQDAGTIALDASGVAHPSSSVVVPTGGLSFRAHYGGDSTYTSGDGPCETLSAIPLTIGKGAIDVQKDANPLSLKEPGGQVTFSVSITNTSNVKVSILDVVDNVYGDLDDSGGNGCFDVPINLAPGESAHCQFAGMVTGTAGQDHVDTVTASGTDEFGNPVSDSDDAHVTITPKLIDLVIVKDATSPTKLNGTVTYTMTVTNKGPDTATDVQLADPAPAGIEYQSASPSQGSCSVGPALVTCNLGTLAAGQTVTITVSAKATSVGTHVNTATVTGSGGRETNPADNTDSAQTVVPAPLKPPTVKPKPPVVEVCLSMTVTPKMITADGKPDRVKAKVRAGKKPSQGTKVVVRGKGFTKTGRTNGKGITVIVVNPKKPGLITITTRNKQQSCGAKRIGVVGVFLPPLTG